MLALETPAAIITAADLYPTADRLNAFSAEVLSRPAVHRCVLCGCELNDPILLAHNACGVAEMESVWNDEPSPFEGVELAPHPSTGFGDADHDLWAADLEEAFADTDTPF